MIISPDFHQTVKHVAPSLAVMTLHQLPPHQLYSDKGVSLSIPYKINIHLIYFPVVSLEQLLDESSVLVTQHYLLLPAPNNY